MTDNINSGEQMREDFERKYAELYPMSVMLKPSKFERELDEYTDICVQVAWTMYCAIKRQPSENCPYCGETDGCDMEYPHPRSASQAAPSTTVPKFTKDQAEHYWETRVGTAPPDYIEEFANALLAQYAAPAQQVLAAEQKARPTRPLDSAMQDLEHAATCLMNDEACIACASTAMNNMCQAVRHMTAEAQGMQTAAQPAPKDAERLDFIEQQGNAFSWGIREHTEPVNNYVVSFGDGCSVDGPTFRAAIDAAMAGMNKGVES